MKIESNKNWTTCLRLNTGDGSPRVFLLNSHFLGSVPLEADAVLFVTPEYDHSVPAQLLNALEWLAFEPFPLLEKPTMIVGASYGNLGTSRAQDHLLDVLRSPQLQAAVQADSGFLLSRSLEAFDENNELLNSQVREKLDKKMSHFLLFVNVSKQNPDLRLKTINKVRTYRYQSEK